MRTTLTYRLWPQLSVGVEYNPRADDVGLLVNWIALSETARRPALIFGTSSDRIGTPSGRSLYLTLSKDLSEQVRLPIAPYGGVAYSTYEDRFLPIGGLFVRFPYNMSSLVIFDGVKVHPTWSFTLKQRHIFTFVLAQGRNPGFSYSISF
ncbi:MAG: hypothetical protein RMM98_07725 [Acidobacteriota bacterium]|nr:hypothetical protein [Blastocatellia bacterium]MDW8239488.1 hypothetical protein [Acidobacteriota bacterium]